MESNNNIQSLWIGKELSVMEIMCIKSYLFHGHPFDLYVYDNVKNIPEGTTIKDGNLIIPQKEIFIDDFGGHVNFSNKFRYMLLYKKGGWWVDMDTVCLKPFDFKEDFIFASESHDSFSRVGVNTTYIKSLPGAKFLKDCLDFLDVRGSENIHWGELGVNLISRMIFRNGLGKYAQPVVTFCPVSINKISSFFDETGIYLPEESYALHWWHSIWFNAGINKNGSFPVTSLYEELKSKYL